MAGNPSSFGRISQEAPPPNGEIVLLKLALMGLRPGHMGAAPKHSTAGGKAQPFRTSGDTTAEEMNC